MEFGNLVDYPFEVYSDPAPRGLASLRRVTEGLGGNGIKGLKRGGDELSTRCSIENENYNAPEGRRNVWNLTPDKIANSEKPRRCPRYEWF